MVIFLFLVFNIFYLFLQDIEAVFFCDDIIKAVYVVDGTNQIPISGERELNEKFIYNYTHLDAVPGDLIKFTCLNGKVPTFGAGCFVLDNQCYCDNFEIDKDHNNNKNFERSFNFGHITCTMSGIIKLQEEINGYYDYQHYIPLDATKISCQNNDNISIFLNGLNYNLKLSSYITADFDIKNVECSISENYNYFFF